MEEVFEKLADYVLLLSNALESDGNTNDRPMLIKHLAAAAEMFALLHKYNELSAIENIVKSEIRSHGWSYIAGPSGESIAHAWVAFTKSTKIEY